MPSSLSRALAGLLLVFSACASLQGPRVSLETRAESSGFKATSLYDDVMTFLKVLDEESDRMRIEIYGQSAEGRDLPLAVLGNPAPKDPSSIDRSRTTVAFIQANIHAGEVAGKEASLMLIREILRGDLEELLEGTVLLVSPIYNADGNERIDPANRYWQPGIPTGVGIRTNAQSLDLNRDMMKLETPEARSMVENILIKWNPDLVVDCHTTNGSPHQEPVTYAPPHNPLCDPELLSFHSAVMLPWIKEDTLRRDGYHAVPYGNFKNRMNPEEGWVTFDHKPRYVTNYTGLRNHLSILVEIYAYADYEVRVRSCLAYLHSVLSFTREHGSEMRAVKQGADASAAAASWKFHKRFEVKAHPEPITIRGYRMEMREDDQGRKRPRPVYEEPREYLVPYFGLFEPNDEGEPLPEAYLFPRGLIEIKEKLEQHGVLLEEIEKSFSEKVRVFRIEKIDTSSRLYQGHRLQELSGRWEETEQEFPAGAFLVPTRQPLARLAAYLLEPESDDGLATWNFFDRYLNRGVWDPRPGTFPVVKRIRKTGPP